MGHWTDNLRMALFGPAAGNGFLDGEVVVTIPEEIYVKELAVYTSVSLIASAIAGCEIVVYEGGKPVKNENWYSLNVRANANESAPRFWHKVVEKMLTAPDEKGAFVFIQGGNLYCADSYNIKEKRPFKSTGNLYDGVSIDDLQMSKIFTARDVMIFKLETMQPNVAIGNMYTEVSKLVAAAMDNYRGTNVQRWKFKVDAVEAGTEEFQKAWQGKLKNAVKKFVDGDSKVYVEYNNRVLDPVGNGSDPAQATDSLQLIEKVYDLVGRAYHIPPGIMTAGNYNISDLVMQFLTFAVDPVAEMIGKTLTAAYGIENFNQGNYFRVDTSKIRHFDIFGMATAIDKLISSGFASVNEVRQAADWDIVGDPDDPDNWLNQHILTKNYEREGGETKSEKKEDV